MSTSVVPAAADDKSYPLMRSLANYTASKLCSLSESDISLLSDDALSRLIDSEISRLPEDELDRLSDEAFSAILPIADAIFDRVFPPPVISPEYQKYLDDMPIFSFDSFLKELACFFLISSISAISFFQLLDRCLAYYKRIDIVTINAPQQAEKKLKPSKRSIFLSKYSRTLHLKGLKGIGETNIQETDTGFRQMMIQESFVNGESSSLPDITPCKTNHIRVRGKEVCS